jgi:hypothetical protein
MPFWPSLPLRFERALLRCSRFGCASHIPSRLRSLAARMHVCLCLFACNTRDAPLTELALVLHACEGGSSTTLVCHHDTLKIPSNHQLRCKHSHFREHL